MKLFLLFTFNANSTSAAWMSDRTRRVWTNKLWCSELWVFSCFNQHFNVSNSCSISSSTAVSCRIQPKKGRTLTFIFLFSYKNLYRKQIFFSIYFPPTFPVNSERVNRVFPLEQSENVRKNFSNVTSQRRRKFNLFRARSVPPLYNSFLHMFPSTPGCGGYVSDR